MQKKSQASLEYLTTYAWAFLIIITIIGVVYYLDLLDFQRFLPQKCTFSSQFPCQDFSVGDGELKVKILNSIGGNIYIKSLEISNKESPRLVCTQTYLNTGSGEVLFPPPSDPLWNAGKEIDIRFAGCSGGGYLKGDRVEAVVAIGYYSLETANPPTAETTHLTKGRIIATVRGS